MGDAYIVRVEFRTDDGRMMLSGEAEQRIEGPFPWSSTVAELVEAMKPEILKQVPDTGSDSTGFIEVVELRVRAAL